MYYYILWELIYTDKLLFFTDKPFCCGKYGEFRNVRLYNLVGADLAEKGRIIHMLSGIFSRCRQELFYSPFERSLPCALYLPEMNSLVASSYNERIAQRLAIRYFDIGRILSERFSPVEEIVGYTMSQSRAYMEKSIDLLGIADLLMKEYVRNTAELLDHDRLRNYSKRKIYSILGRKIDRIGTECYRSVSAVTCSGYKFAELPEDYSIVRLHDDFFAASVCFVKSASKEANRVGFDTIISRAVDTENAPMHLIIPEIKTAFMSESKILKTKFSKSPRLNLNRFYDGKLLCSREHYTGFCGEYIRKMLGEAALYARICMDIKNQGRRLLTPYISEKTAADIASEIVHEIINL